MSILTLEERSIYSEGYILYGYESDSIHIIPPHIQPRKFNGDGILWILPLNCNDKAYMVKTGKYSVKNKKSYTTIEFKSSYEKTEFDGRPRCDFYGKSFCFDIKNGRELENTLAHFYWDNLLQEVAERTFMRKKKLIREGYVLSTLNKKSYGGTYPAVDHEFHIKGRFSFGGKLEAEIIKRMLELQIKIMQEDPKGISRNVCAVQPNGHREYDVWRSSKDHTVKAQMFRVTANIEFVEEVYEYYSMTKDKSFIKNNLLALENNCEYIERFINDNGLLNSHVYYEDQVMKCGAVCQAQAFAINSFKLMSLIEAEFGSNEKKEKYHNLSEKLKHSLIRNYPEGFWDSKEGRFIDWIDQEANKHDHIHLLSNELPILFKLSSEKQNEKAFAALETYADVFNKFPSFVAGKIEDYTLTEIGTGGYYDLCAAGRYWCWDAAFLSDKCDETKLMRQLMQVNEQAKIDNYLMGERYDMNYVYYNKGDDANSNWHGSSLYYEYPNVFCKVLINDYLGVKYGYIEDIELRPLINEGRVRLETYGIEYTIDNGTLLIKNISDRNLSILVNLKAYKIFSDIILQLQKCEEMILKLS